MKGKLYEFRCDRCRIRWDDWTDDPTERPSDCPSCKAPGTRTFGAVAFHMPAWMSDSAIAARSRQRAFLASDKAKKMDLDPCREDDSDYVKSDYADRHPDDPVGDAVGRAFDAGFDKHFEEAMRNPTLGPQTLVKR